MTKSTVSATKSIELATMSTATSCRIHVVADLSPKLATKSTVWATFDFVANLSPVSATVDFVASACAPGLTRGREDESPEYSTVTVLLRYFQSYVPAVKSANSAHVMPTTHLPEIGAKD